MSIPNPFVTPDPDPEPDPTPPPAVAAVKKPQQMSSGVEDEAPGSDTLYQYEGKNVFATVAVITSVSGLEIDDAILRVDEYVNMEVECRVVAVSHKVNQTTGKLMRVHTLKAVDSVLKPWTPT